MPTYVFPFPPLLLSSSLLLSLLLHMATIFNARYASRFVVVVVEGMFELRKHYCNQLLLQLLLFHSPRASRVLAVSVSGAVPHQK